MKNNYATMIIMATMTFIGSFLYGHDEKKCNNAASDTAPLLVHLKQAQKDFDAAKKSGDEGEGKLLYDARLTRIKQYYRSGEYTQDLERICKEAERHFAGIKPNNSLIIFDIDDTAIISHTKTGMFCFLWDSNEQCDQIRKELTGNPIQPVLHLYNFVKNLGYKTAFLSSIRSYEFHWDLMLIQFNHEKIENRLHKAGYDNYETVILKDAFDTNNTGQWKYEQRKKLAEQYFIAGCVGDREQDFYGGYTGYKVKLPNYLY